MFWFYIFLFFIFQGRETTTWLTPGCSQRRQTHWGMEVGFDGFGVSQAPAAEHSLASSTLMHKYFVSVTYSLSSDQFVLLWDNEWSDFFLACARQPRAMQGFHQLNLFPLFCLFEKHVRSVYFFLFCITARLTRHPVFHKSAALSFVWYTIWFDFSSHIQDLWSVVISTDTASYFYYSTISFSVSYFVLYHIESNK